MSFYRIGWALANNRWIIKDLSGSLHDRRISKSGDAHLALEAPAAVGAFAANLRCPRRTTPGTTLRDFRESRVCPSVALRLEWHLW